MIAALWTGYVPPPKPCEYDCKPSRDSPPAMVWALFAFAVVSLITMVVLMVVEARSAPAAD